MTLRKKLSILATTILVLPLQQAAAEVPSAQPTPPEIWAQYDPDKGDFKEEIISESTVKGIYNRESYISAYVNGEEIRVYCKYSVKEGATKAPGLMNVHGWMGRPAIDKGYVNDGWAVLAHDYCGKSGTRDHYTKYPDSLIHGHMDRKEGPPVWDSKKDRKSITHYNESSDYLWYAIQRRALSYLLAQKEVDKTRIGAKGYSYGGTIMWNLGMDSRVKAIVAYFGIGYNNYYRTKRVWMYNTPYVEPKKTNGEEIYLPTMAPQAHAPHITAATLWLNGSNDHHGGHERSGQTFAKFQKNVPWDFAVQARGHHNTEKLGDDCKLWLENHVLDKKHFWPARPTSKTILDSAGIPQHFVTPASPEKVKSVQIHYCLKHTNNIERAWRDAVTTRNGNIWTAKMPMMNVDDYLFAYATIHYDNNCVVSSDFIATIPSKLGKAVATDKPSNNLSEATGAWKDVAPVEGIGGVEGFRVTRPHGTSNSQFSDAKWKAPVGAQLAFKYYCTQPQTIILQVNGGFETKIEITASDDTWQNVVLPAKSLTDKKNPKLAMINWGEAKRIDLKPAPGSDISKVIFTGFKWMVAESESLKVDKDGKAYLSKGLASKSKSFLRVHDDKGFDSKPISVGGKIYKRGLGVHSASEISFQLKGEFTHFHVTPGPDDNQGGIIEMKVLVDGKELYNSGKVSRVGFQAKSLTIPVKGAKTLTLIVTDGGNGPGGDHACWADAYLTAE